MIQDTGHRMADEWAKKARNPKHEALNKFKILIFKIRNRIRNKCFGHLDLFRIDPLQADTSFRYSDLEKYGICKLTTESKNRKCNSTHE